MNQYLNDVFGNGGFLARRFPGYEVRSGQVELAHLVDKAMSDGHHALGEAPCGSGKGIAYGVPAVWHAHHRKKRVVIATANIALQEQLVTKDLPLLAEVLPWPFTFALLKGRANYLCLDRLEDLGEREGLAQDDLGRQIQYLKVWSDQTRTGDISELPFVPEPAVWSRFSVGAKECKGDDCKFFENCFSEKAKAVAANADIVVTNHHMLCAHLAVRRMTGADLVLPPFDLLVVDEAHELADTARDFFGWTLSEPMIMRLAASASNLRNHKLASDLRREAAAFFQAAVRHERSPAYKSRLKVPADATNLLRALGEFTELAAAVEKKEMFCEKRPDDGSGIRRQAETMTAYVREIATLSDRNKVYFIEVDPHGRAKIGAKMVRVGNLLRAELFEKTESVTLVSATLATESTFGFTREELGVPQNAIELVVDSPFDFARQAMLVLPLGLPDPNDENFIPAVAHKVQRVIDACDGRTLALFTSHKNMKAVHERISNNGRRLLRQGDLPRTELTRIFKEDIESVLFGTESFWTGIDVPGEALTAVVIDKLPFPRMDDPVVDAIFAADPQAFNTYYLPRAIIMFRQGVGRLIRSQKDIGVVVILDKRITEKAYGARFLRSLPPMQQSQWIEHIQDFLSWANKAKAA